MEGDTALLWHLDTPSFSAEIKDSGVTQALYLTGTAGKANTPWPVTIQAEMPSACTAAVMALEGLKNTTLPQLQLLPATWGTVIYKIAAVLYYTLSGLEHILRTLVLTSLSWCTCKMFSSPQPVQPHSSLTLRAQTAFSAETSFKLLFRITLGTSFHTLLTSQVDVQWWCRKHWSAAGHQEKLCNKHGFIGNKSC